jgi:hypothetical protein
LLFSTHALSLGSAGGTGDVTLDFNVTTSTPILDDAYLTIAGSVVGAGTATVGETLSGGVSPSQTLTVTLPGTPTDHVTFGPTDHISVLKDALVMSLPGNNTVTSISAIQQDFSETTVIPEPSTWAMLLVGFAGLGYAAFRRPGRNSIFALG